MAGDHLALAIDQDRDIEPERLDAVGDLPDLLLAVAARIGRIRLQLFDPPIDNLQTGNPTSPDPFGSRF